MKPIAVACQHAILVNQKTSADVLGLTRRRYLEVIHRKGVRHVVDGRLVMARTADVIAALGLADEPEPASSWSPADVIAGIGGRK